MQKTPIDAALEEIDAAPSDNAAWLRFYARLADTELFMLLEREAGPDSMEPKVVAPDVGRFVLAFDTEQRLSAFVGAPAPYAALPGRVIAQILEGQGLGMGINLGQIRSKLLTAEAMDWLAGAVQNAPRQMEGQVAEVAQPSGLPQALLAALEAKFGLAAGLAHSALIASVRYADGGAGHVLVFVDAVEAAELGLAHAVSEALTFSGVEAGALDVAFLPGDDPLVARFAEVGVRIAVPARRAAPAPAAAPAPPGMDPDKPPILR